MSAVTRPQARILQTPAQLPLTAPSQPKRTTTKTVVQPEAEPEILVIDNSKYDGVPRRYIRRTLIGQVSYEINDCHHLQGGFAKVYEMKDMQTGRQIAGKIINKETLKRSKARKKVPI